MRGKGLLVILFFVFFVNVTAAAVFAMTNDIPTLIVVGSEGRICGFLSSYSFLITGKEVIPLILKRGWDVEEKGERGVYVFKWEKKKDKALLPSFYPIADEEISSFLSVRQSAYQERQRQRIVFLLGRKEKIRKAAAFLRKQREIGIFPSSISIVPLATGKIIEIKGGKEKEGIYLIYKRGMVFASF